MDTRTMISSLKRLPPPPFFQHLLSSLKRQFPRHAVERNLLIASLLNQIQTGMFLLTAPLIAESCFPQAPLISQLFWIYGILCTSLITRPLGIIMASYGTKQIGINQILQLTCIVACISSILMIVVSTSKGITAVIALIIARILFGMCAAAECTIMRLVILENKQQDEAYQTSALVEGVSMTGFLIASAASSAIFIMAPSVWGYGYIALAFCYMACSAHRIIRLQGAAAPSPAPRLTRLRVNFPNNQNASYTFISSQYTHYWRRIQQTLRALLKNKNKFITITMVTGVSQLTYLFPFILTNTLLPLVTSVKIQELVIWNLILHILDVLLIPITARLLKSSPPLIILKRTLCGLILLFAAIGFAAHLNSSLIIIFTIRVGIVILGVIFLTPQLFYFNAFLQSTKPHISDDQPCDRLQSIPGVPSYEPVIISSDIPSRGAPHIQQSKVQSPLWMKNHHTRNEHISHNVLIMGLARTASSALFGRLTPVLCTVMIHYYHSFIPIGLYGAALCAGTLWCLYNPKYQK